MFHLASISRRCLALVFVLACALGATPASAERIKDLASVQGVRGNQLVGYGLVVGLDGTGDQTTQAPFTTQSMLNMLANLGINMPPGQTLQLKNVAAVMVTASMPPFAAPGQVVDVTVSSIGNAKSLRGGTLVMTPLKGADGQIYAMAQGSVVGVGVGEAAGGSKIKINHLSVGRIAGGATVERPVSTALGEGPNVFLQLNTTDFGTARRMVDAINRMAGSDIARALDGRQIQVVAPQDPHDRVAFLGSLENLDVVPALAPAKVVVNARTGSVVMNQKVTIENCAVAHGNLSVVVSTEPVVSQPKPFSQGQTVAAQRSQIDVKEGSGALMNVKAGANLADVVKGLNALGASPQDLMAILQAMKAAGALRADLEII